MMRSGMMIGVAAFGVAVFGLVQVSAAPDVAVPENPPVYEVDPGKLAALSEDDRDDVLDLIGDVNSKRERAAEEMRRAAKDRARGKLDRATEREASAAEKWADAEADAARVVSILAGKGDPGPAPRGQTPKGEPASAPARAAAQAMVDAPKNVDGNGRLGVDAAIANATRKEGDFALEAARIVTQYPDGTLTLWIEDHGARVAKETDRASSRDIALWQEGRTYADRRDGSDPFTSPFRIRDMEAGPFATTPAKQLEQSGHYERVGDCEVLGRTGELWRYRLPMAHAKGYAEGCRWNGLELKWTEFDGRGGASVAREVIELEVGAGIPKRFDALVT